MGRKVYVVGVGMTKFEKPGSKEWDYPDMAKEAGEKALADCDLHVTLEPCAMCAQAIALARVRRLHFGAYDPKGGGVEHGARVFDHPTCHHRPELVGGIEETRSGDLLKRFFRDRR